MNIREKIRESWKKACNHDGIPEDSKFIVFSEDNPFIMEYDKWVRMFQVGEKIK